jgi:hypothetical protein
MISKLQKWPKSKNPQKEIFKKFLLFDQIYLYIQNRGRIFKEINN